jgi:hypothetical protein
MASNYKYTRSTTTTLKVAGLVNVQDGTIEVDGEVKKIIELLKDFDSEEIELTAKIKTDEDLSE